MPAPDAQTRALNTDLAIRTCITHVAADPGVLAEIVAAGEYTFRVGVLKTFEKGYKLGEVDRIDEAMANRMFCALCVLWQRFYQNQYGNLTAGQFLDRVEIHRGPTQEEIDQAWELESNSTEDGNRTFYGRMNPNEYFDKLKQGATPRDLQH